MICTNCNGAQVKRIAVDIYKCPNCGHVQFRDGSTCDLDESEYERIYKKSAERPAGCEACDSDMYPICREGCPLIDN